MQMEIQESSEKVKTWLFLSHIAVSNGFVHEAFGLQHFVKFDLLVNRVASQWKAVTADYRNDLEAVGVLILWVLFPRLCKVLARH